MAPPPTRAHRRPPAAPTRKVLATALALVVLGGVGAFRAGAAGNSFMHDLEQVHPPLAKLAPVIDEAPAPRLARRVFLVIVDGLGYDRSYQLPFLDELRRRGADTEASSHYPTWSRPNYVSILTGVPPLVSGVRTNHHATPVVLDSLMDRARSAGLRVATASDYEVLPRLFLRRRGELAERPRTPVVLHPDDEDDDAGALEEPLEDAADQPEDPPLPPAIRTPDADLASPFDDARYTPWPGGFSEAGEAIAAGDAELVILLVGAPDAAGHRYGAASPEYRAAALAVDHALARVLARVDLALDAVVVTSDHGHTTRGSHGGIEPEVLAVPLIAAGAGIAPGSTAADARLIDVAPTVAALLGIPAPGHGLGRTLTELLDADPAVHDARRYADRLRLIQTLGAVAVADARARVDVLEYRTARIALVASGALLALAFAIIAVRRRVLRLDLRLLVVTIPAFFIVYVALIGTVGGFSPSFLPARGHIADVLLRYGLVAITVQILANLWALRGEPRLADRLAAANGIAWVGLMLTMVPAGLVWAFFPPPYVMLPGPTWLVVIPAVQVAVACTAITMAFTLAIEVIVFAARARYRGAGPPAAPPPG